jgi:hypothetical protein
MFGGTRKNKKEGEETQRAVLTGKGESLVQKSESQALFVRFGGGGGNI